MKILGGIFLLILMLTVTFYIRVNYRQRSVIARLNYAGLVGNTIRHMPDSLGLDYSKTRVKARQYDRSILFIENPGFTVTLVKGAKFQHEFGPSSALLQKVKNLGFSEIIYSNGKQSWIYQVE